MKNKLLVCVLVPDIDKNFDVFIPINKKIGNIINLLNKAITDISEGNYVGTKKTLLYDRETGEKYPVNKLVRETSIKNSTQIVLI